VELENLLDRAAETQRNTPPANQSGVPCLIQPHRPEARFPQQPPQQQRAAATIVLLLVHRYDCAVRVQYLLRRVGASFWHLFGRCPHSNWWRAVFWGPQRELQAVSLVQPHAMCCLTASLYADTSAWRLQLPVNTDNRARHHDCYTHAPAALPRTGKHDAHSQTETCRSWPFDITTLCLFREMDDVIYQRAHY
jgi:hypothetical protein